MSSVEKIKSICNLVASKSVPVTVKSQQSAVNTGTCFLLLARCNYLQPKNRFVHVAGSADSPGRLLSAAAICAIATYLHAGDQNMELAFPLDLTLQAIEEIALEFQDFPTAQARHVEVIAFGTALVKVLFSLKMHEIQLVYQAMPLEKFEGAIHRNAVDVRIDAAGFTEQLAGVQVLFCSFYDAKDRAALAGHANAT
jgi:hypothetical protein